jgi:hypothetical protein
MCRILKISQKAGGMEQIKCNYEIKEVENCKYLESKTVINGSLKKLSVRGATALTNLGRLSSRRWQSFPTAPDGTGLTCGQHIESHSCIFQHSKPDRYFFIQVTTQFIRSRG